MQGYDVIKQYIIDRLEAGDLPPWRQTWNGGSYKAPVSLNTGKEYNGINRAILGSAGFESEFFMTRNQIEKQGGSVNSGATPLPVIYAGRIDDEDKDGKPRSVFIHRCYTVFNMSETAGIDYPKPDPPSASKAEKIEACEKILHDMPCNRPAIIHTGTRACYSQARDMIKMPTPESFGESEEYYSTLFHEIAHSTGHVSRLGRFVCSPAPFGTPDYSREELVAEFTAAFVCGTAGIAKQTLENSASYIQNWLAAIKKTDGRDIVKAAAEAQKAADWILGLVAVKAPPTTDKPLKGNAAKSMAKYKATVDKLAPDALERLTRQGLIIPNPKHPTSLLRKLLMAL